MRDSKNRQGQISPGRARASEVKFLLAMDMQRKTTQPNQNGYELTSEAYWHELIADSTTEGAGVYVVKEGGLYIGFLAVSQADIAHDRQVSFDAIYINPNHEHTLAASKMLDLARVSIAPIPLSGSTPHLNPDILAGV